MKEYCEYKDIVVKTRGKYKGVVSKEVVVYEPLIIDKPFSINIEVNVKNGIIAEPYISLAYRNRSCSMSIGSLEPKCHISDTNIGVYYNDIISEKVHYGIMKAIFECREMAKLMETRQRVLATKNCKTLYVDKSFINKLYEDIYISGSLKTLNERLLNRYNELTREN